MSTATGMYFYPNNMGRIILLALEDVIGQTGINMLTNLSEQVEQNTLPPANFDRHFPFERLSTLMAGLENYYGSRAGRGLALRTGQACFQYGLENYGALLGASDMAFRLLPLPTKLKIGAELFAQAFNQFSDQQVQISETEEIISWQIERCPLCWQRHTDAPACHLAVGILQEALYWISSGKYFNVEETSCIAQGDSACTIEINKTPLG